MVQAIIDINDHTNRIINIVKAKHGLKDKSQAIDLIALQYEECVLEPELRPEYAKSLKNISREKAVKFSNIKQLKEKIKDA